MVYAGRTGHLNILCRCLRDVDIVDACAALVCLSLDKSCHEVDAYVIAGAEHGGVARLAYLDAVLLVGRIPCVYQLPVHADPDVVCAEGLCIDSRLKCISALCAAPCAAYCAGSLVADREISSRRLSVQFYKGDAGEIEFLRLILSGNPLFLACAEGPHIAFHYSAVSLHRIDTPEILHSSRECGRHCLQPRRRGGISRRSVQLRLALCDRHAVFPCIGGRAPSQRHVGAEGASVGGVSQPRLCLAVGGVRLRRLLARCPEGIDRRRILFAANHSHDFPPIACRGLQDNGIGRRLCQIVRRGAEEHLCGCGTVNLSPRETLREAHVYSAVAGIENGFILYAVARPDTRRRAVHDIAGSVEVKVIVVVFCRGIRDVGEGIVLRLARIAVGEIRAAVGEVSAIGQLVRILVAERLLCRRREVVVLREHLSLRMEADAIRADILPIAVVDVHLAIADARIALGVVLEHTVCECHTLLAVVLIVASAGVCDAHLVVVVELHPRDGEEVRTVGDVKQTVVRIGEVAMVHPHMMAVVEGYAVDAPFLQEDVADDDVALVGCDEGYAVERLSRPGADDGLV